MRNMICSRAFCLPFKLYNLRTHLRCFPPSYGSTSSLGIFRHGDYAMIAAGRCSKSGRPSACVGLKVVAKAIWCSWIEPCPHCLIAHHRALSYTLWLLHPYVPASLLYCFLYLCKKSLRAVVGISWWAWPLTPIAAVSKN